MFHNVVCPCFVVSRFNISFLGARGGLGTVFDCRTPWRSFHCCVLSHVCISRYWDLTLHHVYTLLSCLMNNTVKIFRKPQSKIIFSAVSRSSCHRILFEPSSEHMWDKPSSACGWSGGFSRGSPVYVRPTLRLTRLKIIEIVLMGRKTLIQTKTPKQPKIEELLWHQHED